MKTMLFLCLVLAVIISDMNVNACCPQRIGPDRVKIDSSCMDTASDDLGGAGCNAGGYHQACRFCGKRGWVDCD